MAMDTMENFCLENNALSMSALNSVKMWGAVVNPFRCNIWSRFLWEREKNHICFQNYKNSHRSYSAAKLEFWIRNKLHWSTESALNLCLSQQKPRSLAKSELKQHSIRSNLADLNSEENPQITLTRLCLYESQSHRLRENLNSTIPATQSSYRWGCCTSVASLTVWSGKPFMKVQTLGEHCLPKDGFRWQENLLLPAGIFSLKACMKKKQKIPKCTAASVHQYGLLNKTKLPTVKAESQ